MFEPGASRSCGRRVLIDRLCDNRERVQLMVEIHLDGAAAPSSKKSETSL